MIRVSSKQQGVLIPRMPTPPCSALVSVCQSAKHQRVKAAIGWRPPAISRQMGTLDPPHLSLLGRDQEKGNPENICFLFMLRNYYFLYFLLHYRFKKLQNIF
ncbi:UNVERIFIED_CONTAM: hypothetical protein K2H54_013497 [Gekko kuhli]